MTKDLVSRMLDEGLTYAQMAERGYAPIEYKAYQVKVRKHPFRYVVMSLADIEETCKVIEGLRDRLARAEGRCVEVAETMTHASERIAGVEDWLVLWRDGGRVGSVEHEIAACKQASWYLWSSETAEEIHRIAALATPTAPNDGAARVGDAEQRR